MASGTLAWAQFLAIFCVWVTAVLGAVFQLQCYNIVPGYDS